MQWLAGRRHTLSEGKDGGATMVAFVVMLAALLAAMGLGIDGSALFAKRQQVQNGADAAAFAIAQEYALSGCSEDYSLAQSYAAKNVPNENDTVQADSVSCDGNAVTVVASGQQSPIFMQFAGVDPIRVPADATVEWGSPAAGEGFPLAFSECVFDAATASGGLVEVWVPDEPWNAAQRVGNPCSGEDYPAGGFGWLATDGDCKADYADVSEGVAPVNGEPGNDDKTGCDWPTIVGTTVLVPVFADDDGTGRRGLFYVSKFASFELVGVRIHTGSPSRFGFAGYPAACTVKPTWGRWKNHCVFGRFVEYVTIDDAFELGPVTNPDTLVIRLTS